MVPTIQQIIKDYLVAHDFDGLFCEDIDCACVVDDLMPCGNPYPDCTPGKRVPCDCGEHDYHIEGVSDEEGKVQSK